jgi:hypothetical protein
VVDRLNGSLPAGLSFVRVVPLAEDAPGLSRAITAATYLATVPGVAADLLRQAVDEFNGASERFFDKVRKEKSVSLDLKRFVGGVVLVDLMDGEGGGASLRFPVMLDQAEGSVKPDEVLRGILGRETEGASFVRERLHFTSSQDVS